MNDVLKDSGFTSDLLTVGRLKNVDDFDLSKILVRNDYKITIRFNTFKDALNVFEMLNSKINSKGTRVFRSYFENPAPNFYDGKFAT